MDLYQSVLEISQCEIIRMVIFQKNLKNIVSKHFGRGTVKCA